MKFITTYTKRIDGKINLQKKKLNNQIVSVNSLATYVDLCLTPAIIRNITKPMSPME